MAQRALSENKMALYNILSTVIVAGINFFSIPIFTRMLSTSGYGIVTVYTAWVQICTVFVGLKADGSIGSAQANLPEDEQDGYQLSILGLGGFSFIVILSLAILFKDTLCGLLDMDFPLVIAMILQSFGAFVISLFSMRFIFRKQAQKNLVLSVGLSASTTLLSVFLIFFVFTGPGAYAGRVWGLVLPNLFIGLGLFFALLHSTWRQFRIIYWQFCLALSLPLIFHGLSQLVLAQTGRIALQRFYNDSLAGIYGVAVTVTSLLNSVYTALNNAFVPFMYEDLAGKTTWKIKQEHFRNYFTLFTLGTMAFLFVSPEIVKILSTPDYWSGVNVLAPLIVGQYCVFLYSFPVNYEFFKMKTASVGAGTVLAALANLMLTVWLVPPLGMIGAAVATMIAYLLLFVFHFCIARYHLGDHHYSARWMLSGLALVFIVGILVYPLQAFWLTRWILGIGILAVAGLRVIRKRRIF